MVSVFLNFEWILCTVYAGLSVQHMTTHTACMTPLRTSHIRCAPKYSSRGQFFLVHCYIREYCRVRTDSGKSWNLKVTFSRPGKSWNQAYILENHGNANLSLRFNGHFPGEPELVSVC